MNQHELAMLTLYCVVGLCVVTSLAIWIYARVALPRRVERRIRQSISAFSVAIELRFPSHRGLSERVVQLSVEVGKRLRLPSSSIQDIELAARLRDIGLCAIPYKLVNETSPYDWDEADWATYNRHAEVSGAMLELVPHLRRLAPIVRHHHLKFRPDDEYQVPQGNDIPIESRIVHAVADFVWQSRLQGHLLAKDFLKRGRGSEYDPAVVDALLQALTLSGVESATRPTIHA